jgi:GntR family transcriptional regulator
VIDSLTDFIECNKFLQGYQLPAEAELCHSFAVSHTIIHQDIKDLVYKGLIYRKKGRGTLIAEPKINERFVQDLTGFYLDMESKRHRRELAPKPIDVSNDHRK